MDREPMEYAWSRAEVPRSGSNGPRKNPHASVWKSALAGLLVFATAGCSTFSGDAGKRSGGNTRGGGYYLDDGPGDQVPANLDQVPDAVPRLEPLHRGATRPYAVMGRSYTPMTQLQPYRARGTATWYGRRYHGNRTATGEIYDMYAMTAAHTVLPIPSYARVTNVANGRSVVVRINDRGPFLGERLIDLSYVAAHKLDLLRNGSGLVEVESILPDSFAAQTSQSAYAAPAGALAAQPPSADTVSALPSEASDPTQSASGASSPASSFFYLQLGAFAVRENAERFLERMRSQLAGSDSNLAVMTAGAWHRVHSGPYASRDAALAAASRIGETLGMLPVLIAPR